MEPYHLAALVGAEEMIGVLLRRLVERRRQRRVLVDDHAAVRPGSRWALRVHRFGSRPLRWWSPNYHRRLRSLSLNRRFQGILGSVCVCVCVCFKKKGFEMKVKSATFQKGACEATMADSATSSVLSVLVHCSLHK